MGLRTSMRKLVFTTGDGQPDLRFGGQSRLLEGRGAPEYVSFRQPGDSWNRAAVHDCVEGQRGWRDAVSGRRGHGVAERLWHRAALTTRRQTGDDVSYLDLKAKPGGERGRHGGKRAMTSGRACITVVVGFVGMILVAPASALPT